MRSNYRIYRNNADFLMLIVHLATLLNWLIRSNSDLVESLGRFLCKTVSSAKRDNFISSFLILITFISFYCHIILAGTSSPILNRNGESGAMN